MSAFLEKQKLLDWLYERQSFTLGNRQDVYNRVIYTVESGRFDWTSEGE